MDPPKISFAASIGTSLESFKPTDLPHPSPDSAPSCPVSDSSSYHEQEEELKVAKFPEEDKASNPTRAPSPTSQEPFSFTLQTDHSTLPDLIRKELHPLQLSHPVPYSSMAESSSAKRAKRTDSTAMWDRNSSKPLNVDHNVLRDTSSSEQHIINDRSRREDLSRRSRSRSGERIRTRDRDRDRRRERSRSGERNHRRLASGRSRSRERNDSRRYDGDSRSNREIERSGSRGRYLSQKQGGSPDPITTTCLFHHGRQQWSAALPSIPLPISRFPY